MLLKTLLALALAVGMVTAVSAQKIRPDSEVLPLPELAVTRRTHSLR